MSMLERIRAGAYVAERDEPGVRIGAGTRLSLADSARSIREGADPLATVRDFLDQAAQDSGESLATLMVERPALTGLPTIDALLAGVAEHLTASRGQPAPGWVHDDDRFLDRFWFVSSVPGFRAAAIAQTPIALKRRGVFWPARSMERV